MKIQSESQPKPEDAQFVRDSLQAHNDKFAEPLVHKSLSIFLRDDEGKIQGGVLGSLYWEWMYITHFWVADELRGQGYGSQLLQMAEQEAKERGCIGIHLDTHDFQAPQFYADHGYELCGQIDDLPLGHTRFEFKKMF